jgi:hypothetical protein
MVQGLDNPWTRSPLVNGPLGYFPAAGKADKG